MPNVLVAFRARSVPVCEPSGVLPPQTLEATIAMQVDKLKVLKGAPHKEQINLNNIRKAPLPPKFIFG